MRTLLAGPLAVLLLAASLPAAERDDALAVIADAVKAHGGADSLAKAQQMTRTSSGVLSALGKDTPFTDELLLSLPDRYNHTLFVGPGGGNRPKVVVVLAKDKGWQQTGGMTMDLGADRVAELRGDIYLLWLTTLTPLQKDDGFTLAPLPDEKVNGQPAAVIKVGRKGQSDVRLFFDKSSRLLVKADRRGREGGVEFPQEFFFSEHKDFDGASLPTKILEQRSGRKFTELSEVKYKMHTSVDDAKFGKP
jgi:hypothetical protein